VKTCVFNFQLMKKKISVKLIKSLRYIVEHGQLECTSFNEGLDICKTSHINGHICVQMITKIS